MHLLKTHDEYKLSIFIWLITLTIMVLAIIIIGGLTRLTDSGLSMVDWQPILGTIPPLSLNDWNEKFELYKLSPEYLYVNKNMSLVEFKYIFWWEWFHRFFARMIGLVMILPLLYFTYKKYIKISLHVRLLFIFLLGALQAFVGWWMVKSGLSDDPYVSAYRLTFHLFNALLIFLLLLWTTMEYYYSKNVNFFKIKLNLEFLILIAILLTLFTIITGGFMAGTHAGQSFNTYPLMNGKIIPDDYYLYDLGLLNMFENTIAINFNHRWMGTFTFIYVFSLFLFLMLNKNFKTSNLIFLFVLIALSTQFFLGILTLLSNVHIPYASLHQANSVILLSTLMISYYHSKIRNSNNVNQK
ncbi:MAG: heme A synthase [Pelagibacteraceae bacterium]|nr:heme A synthase [Pelagibacteraceae bacterium]|tara:strand:+ start:31336 stop:32400 length:1065 start_codon:yes stop_codon:yes gene_type:complete